jgi:putative ABC transport system permease protein
MPLTQDLAYGARTLRRNPAFTAIAVATLALGIGANTAIFSLVDAVLLRPLPYDRPHELVSVKDDLRGLNLQDVGMSEPELEDYRDRSVVFREISAVWPISANITGGERPERVEALATGTNYFSMLGAKPQLGRVFGPQDRADGFAEAAVLSDGLWKRLFGGDPQALGRQLRLDTDLYTVVGVMPSDFRHPGRTLQGAVEIWITAGFTAAPFPKPPIRGARMLPGAIARLAAGLTVAQAQSRLEAFTAGLSAQYPREYPPSARWTPRLAGLQDDLTGNLRSTLLLVFGGVLCVLLICCVSLANLVVAKAIGRQREIAVRRALGAPWGSLLRQFTAESLLLASIGGAAGCAIVTAAAPLLPRLVPMTLPVSRVDVDARVLAFAVGISLLTGLVFGVAPAFPMMRSNIVANLKEGSRGSSVGQAHHRMRNLLVGCEIGFSLVLLAAAGLLVHSFWNISRIDPGFNPKNVAVASLWLPVPNDPKQFKYGPQPVRRTFIREVLRRAAALPGVTEAAIGNGNSTPLSGFNSAPYQPEGFAGAPGERPVAETTSVSPAFFRTLGVRLRQGRAFAESDEGAHPVVIVDETLARRTWPGQDPIGKRIGTGAPVQWATVVGVVAALKGSTFEAPDAPHLYFPVYARSNVSLTVYLQTAGDPSVVTEPLRRAVQSVDPDLPVFGVRTMEQVVARALAQRRFQLQMIGAFAAVALLLAALGIYGVTSFWVHQRRQEIGIRIALGAPGANVVSMVLKQGLAITLWGMAGGFAAAVPLARVLRTLLFGTAAFDAPTFATIAVLLLAAAAAACYLPARRATKVDPIEALRSE